ncbi:MAG TPA: helix-turn-helix transcriptional regulator [Candidatus Sulfotelmatobacter sp.]|nr:helix-turn-helix transcriptional regulator [Candidatus Sulfotelmatobacter sp.]
METDGSRGQGKAASSRRRGRRRGLEIRPGSVKQARLEAGLSLGQVALNDISRTAIYFVETGKAKPSMETLQLIAQRTGRPIDFFLEADADRTRAEARLLELERLLASGDNAGAVAAGEAALALHPDAATEAHINMLTSLAHLRVAEPVVGRRLAVAARAYYERTGDLLMVAECLGNEAQAAFLMEDPSSVQIAEGALATVRSMKPVPRITEARLLAVVGATLVHDHQWEKAIEFYEQAIAAADVVQDLKNLSLLYSGLSVSYEATGQLERAGHYAQRALQIHETLSDRMSLARSENNLGLLLLRGGNPAAAKPHIERALLLFEEVGVETGKSHILLSSAELALAKHELGTAEDFARQGLELAGRLGENATVAEAHFWFAQIAHARGDSRAVETEFAAALRDLDLAGGRERTARYRAAYAEILESRGDLAGANQQLKLALAELGAQPAAAIQRTASA